MVSDGMDLSQINDDAPVQCPVDLVGQGDPIESTPPMSPHALVGGRAIPKNYGAIFKAYYIEARFRVYSANLYSGALNALRMQLRGLYDD